MYVRVVYDTLLYVWHNKTAHVCVFMYKQRLVIFFPWEGSMCEMFVRVYICHMGYISSSPPLFMYVYMYYSIHGVHVVSFLAQSPDVKVASKIKTHRGFAH
jgi:hypothetical protein